MKHPVLSFRENLIYYALVWIALAAVHILIVDRYTVFELPVAFTDGAVSQLLMGVTGLGLWYLVRYSDPNVLRRGRLLVNLVLGGAVLVVFWLLLSAAILHFIYRNYPGVVEFIRTTMVLRFVVGFVLYLMVIAFYYLVNYHRLVRKQLEAESLLQRTVKETELAYLRSQINPHFLFNALNSVSALIGSNPEKAQLAVVELSKYLRHVMQMSTKTFVTVSEELQHINMLLDIEQIRYSDRLNKEVHIADACGDRMLPALILQPLFENALKYGLHESTGQVLIAAGVHCDEDKLYVSVRNSYDTEARAAEGTSLGLKNVKQRLDILYHKNYKMIINDENNMFEVKLVIPQQGYPAGNRKGSLDD
jgi:sensor histidine kinase YesM